MRFLRFTILAILVSASSLYGQTLRPPRKDQLWKRLNAHHLVSPPAEKSDGVLTHANAPRRTAGPALSKPLGLAFDRAGNLYIATGFNEVLKVTPQGKRSIFAGTGAAGYSGDGGPAADATLGLPVGVAVDAAGNVFISDFDNNVIREVDASGTIRTFAGGAQKLCAGAANAIGDGCVARQATLNHPEGLAIDAEGNLLIADTFNQVVRKVAKGSGIISTIAGGAARVCAGGGGKYGDGCPATEAWLSSPQGLAADAFGNVFIVDPGTSTVRKVNEAGIISLYAGNYSAGFAANGVNARTTPLNSPQSAALDASGNLYIADDINNEIRRVDATTHSITNVAGNAGGRKASSGDGGPATSATFVSTWGVAISPVSGDLAVSDEGNNRVRVVDAMGRIGTFVPAAVTADQVEVVFPKQQVNTTSLAQIINVTNSNATAVTIVSITIDNPVFAETDTCQDSTLEVEGTCQIFVTYTPTTACSLNGGDFASLTITDNTTDDPTTDVELIGMGFTAGGLTTDDLNDDSLSATGLAQELVGSGVTVSNVVYTGAKQAAGTFAGGQNILGIGSGVVLSSGAVSNVIGPNCSTGISAANDTPGDPDLDTLVGVQTNDAAVLEFDFVPAGGTLRFQYVFGSDEYSEFVGQFDDVFGFFVNGTNAALLPGTTTPVSINTVNNGNSGDATVPISNPQFFVNNDIEPPTPPVQLNTELDGLTVVLSVQVPVNAGVTNHIKLAIADALDEALDSDVFIQAGSLNSSTLELSVGTLAFANQAAGSTSPPQTVTVTNAGVNAVTFAGIAASAGFIESTTCGATLGSNQSCTINVSFAPTAPGVVQGSLTVTSNANGPNTVQTVSLSGTGVQPLTITLTPPSLTFAAQAQNTTSAPLTLTVSNDSTSVANAVFTSFTVSGPFALAAGGTCATGGAGLAPDTSCTILVTFTPTGTAASSGSLVLQDNASGNPQSVPLSGATTSTAATVTVTPATVTFPAQAQNTTSAPMTVTVKNTSTGAQTVTFSNISATGPFAVSGGTCVVDGTPLAVNASCTITITFTPTGTAASSGTLSVADNATGSPQTVTLNGTTAAQVTTVMVTPATVTFPAQTQNTTSAPMTVTVKNVSTGSETVTFSAISASGPFAVSGGTCVVDGTPLAPNASCTIAVTFTPTGTAASSGTLSIADDASGSPQTVTLNGTTLGPPTVTVTPPSLTFPATVQNTTSAPLTVTVKNTSTGAQTISFTSISVGEGAFAISGGTCSTDSAPLAVNASCTISVTFTPTGAAASSGTLSIADNATGSPQNVPLNGTTLVPQISVQITPASVTFPATLQNTTSAPQTVTVKNTSTGGGTVSFSNISTGEGPFAVSGGTCSTDSAPLAANASCTITVTFTPTGTATSSGALTIADNALNSPQSVPLNGTTLVPQTLVSVTPPSLTFPATTQGTTSAAMTVTVMNTSTNEATVSFSNISASEPFAVSEGTCQADSDTGISVGSSCTITVTFTPTGTEPSSGSLTITDNAVDSPQSVPLSGTTLIPQTFTLTVGGNGDGSATVNPGDTAVFPIVLTGTEGTTGTVDLTCTPSTPTITCTVTPTSITLNGTTSVNTGISVVTFCSWAPPVGGPSGRWGGPRRFMIPVGSLIGLLLMLVLFARAQRRRWVPAMAAVLLLAVGVAGCKSLAKGPEGKTSPGTYTLTLTGTLDGQSQSLPLTLIVK